MEVLLYRHRLCDFVLVYFFFNLNLVDWKGLELPSTERRCKLEASVTKFEHSPCSPTVLVEWIELKETLAKFQAESCKETTDDKGSDDLISKAECKRKSDASPEIRRKPIGVLPQKLGGR